MLTRLFFSPPRVFTQSLRSGVGFNGIFPKEVFFRQKLSCWAVSSYPPITLPQPDIHLYLLSWLPRKVCCLLKLSSAWGTLSVEGKKGEREKKKNSRHMHTWQHIHKYNRSMALTSHKSVGLSGSQSWIFKCQSVRATWGSFHNPVWKFPVVSLSRFLHLSAEKKKRYCTKKPKLLFLQSPDCVFESEVCRLNCNCKNEQQINSAVMATVGIKLGVQ